MIAINSSQPLVHLVCKFVLDGKTYDVDGFSMGFLQPTGFNGKPQHEIRGGQMSILLNQMADENLIIWAKKETQLKSGVVLFQTDMGMTVMEITFERAYCINLSDEIDALSGTSTTVIISPKIVSLYGITHTNDWGVND